MKCRNCHFELDKNDNFCSHCGAKIIDKRLSIRNLSAEVLQAFWSLESSKPVITFINLFRNPLDVIEGYINGLRNRYISPYGYFTIALSLTGIYTFIYLTYFPEYIDSRITTKDLDQQEISRELTTEILRHINLITFLFIPVLTLLSRLVFWKDSRYNLAEHLIIHLYAYSHIHIVSSLLNLISLADVRAFQVMHFISIPLYFIYYTYILKLLYRLSLGKMLLKTLLFSLVLALVYFVLIVLTLAVLSD
ncbi:DUF3667 domain-containing protein [Gramella sp. BOM4]|nr:DUF3667 domain-containing protein [Christiangramia bathymodioli]